MLWRVCSSVALLASVLVAMTGCGARKPPVSGPVTTAPAPVPEPPPDPAELVRRGCFACLERALALAREQNLPHVAFEAATLLTLRAKELGMPPAEWLEQARAVAGGETSRLLMIEIADALPADPRGGARDELVTQTPRRQRTAAMSPQWIEALEQGSASPEFRTYLRLALTCTSDDPAMTAADAEAVIPEAVRDVPLVRYRLGICGNDRAAVLSSVRAADDEFVDADYPLGRYAVQMRPYPDLDEAVRRLRSAAAAFPRSSAIATMGGDVFQTLEAWSDALASYDAALALVAGHPDALIGRTITLSNLDRNRDAIATATLLIDRGRWFLGQALYWRAWNYFQVEEYSTARQDADRARTQMVNPGLYLLSGMIDWRLRRLDSAEREFEEALRMDFGQCEAATFLGGVRNELSKLTPALEAFKQAARCYDLTITLRRAAIDRLEAATDAPPSHKAREIARHQRAIDLAEKRRSEALNGVDLLQKYLTSTQAPPQSQRQ